MPPCPEFWRLTRASVVMRATGTTAASATVHNPLIARRSTAARSANNKLDCRALSADGFAASSAAIIFQMARSWRRSSRVMVLHLDAGYVAYG